MSVFCFSVSHPTSSLSGSIRSLRHNPTNKTKFFFVGELFYAITSILIRLSIGFYLLRICLYKVHTWIIRITMFIITLLTVMYFIFCVVQCSPVSYFWLQFSGEPGRCLPPMLVQNVSIAYAVFAAATDIIFGILPITVIWNLKMNRKAKMVVGCLLALGIMYVTLRLPSPPQNPRTLGEC
jgi:hypothetical protein